MSYFPLLHHDFYPQSYSSPIKLKLTAMITHEFHFNFCSNPTMDFAVIQQIPITCHSLITNTCGTPSKYNAHAHSCISNIASSSVRYINNKLVLRLDLVFKWQSLCRERHRYYVHAWQHRHFIIISISHRVAGDFHPPSERVELNVPPDES